MTRQGLDLTAKSSKFAVFFKKIWKTNLSLFTDRFKYGIVFAANLAEAKLVQVVNIAITITIFTADLLAIKFF